jgi:peroxiredoxin Q/BCP
MQTRRRALNRIWWMAGGAVIVAAALWGADAVLTSTDLTVGDPAPDFRLPASDGRTYALADYRGRQVVVLAWFPKAFTAG